MTDYMGPVEVSDVVRVYQDENDEWRWTLKAAGNHEIINASTEGYVRKVDAIANLKRATGRDHWEESLG